MKSREVTLSKNPWKAGGTSTDGQKSPVGAARIPEVIFTATAYIAKAKRDPGANGACGTLDPATGLRAAWRVTRLLGAPLGSPERPGLTQARDSMREVMGFRGHR